ncbi:MAG: response regulator [Armatimonadetes bacterium]|nr:response regulator [Armatimonadota bacterium]
MEERLLVLEDDATMREVLLVTLQDMGHRVYGARSANEALELARSMEFTLVITDVRMPGMDGLDFLLALRRSQPWARSIVITGYADQDAPSRAIAAQADDYMRKPFTLTALTESIDRVLGRGEDPARELLPRTASEDDEAWIELEELRDRVFQGFFVGVRSEMLDNFAAWRLWNRLEELESQREQLSQQLTEVVPSEAVPELATLVQGYRSVLDILTRASSLEPPRAVIQMRRDRFDHFFRQIQEGKVTPERIMMAPGLRLLPAERLKSSTALKELYRSVWGEAP